MIFIIVKLNLHSNNYVNILYEASHLYITSYCMCNDIQDVVNHVNPSLSLIAVAVAVVLVHFSIVVVEKFCLPELHEVFRSAYAVQQSAPGVRDQLPLLHDLLRCALRRHVMLHFEEPHRFSTELAGCESVGTPELMFFQILALALGPALDALDHLLLHASTVEQLVVVSGMDAVVLVALAVTEAVFFPAGTEAACHHSVFAELFFVVQQLEA